MAKNNRWINRSLYCCVFLLVAGGVLYLASQGDLGPKEIGTAFLAMVGTFLGALFAFRLNESKENVKREDERRGAMQFALFVLIRQHNALRNIAKYLTPFKSEFARAFNCPAYNPAPLADLVHDFPALSFLLDEDPTLVLHLSVEQEAFHQTLDALKIRNEFYVNEVLLKIEQAGLNKKLVQAVEFKAALGERVFETAINYANRAYQGIEQAQGRNENIIKVFHAMAKKLYPNEKFASLQTEGSATV